MSEKLYEVVLPTDRWSARAVSPTDIREGVDPATHTVIVNPGWAKKPESYTELLDKLTSAGFLAIGVDTRFGYSDQQKSTKGRPRVVSQSYTAGYTNPYFDDSSQRKNRWLLRKPTSLLYICEELGVNKRTLIGHSEGGRVATLAAFAKPELTDGLVIVNATGTGDSRGGLRRLATYNANRLKEIVEGSESLLESSKSALDSLAYGASHPRRTFKEKAVIEDANIWSYLAELVDLGKPVSVLHAVDDELISFEDSERQARAIPGVNFVPTSGGHGNVYNPEITDLMVSLAQRQFL